MLLLAPGPAETQQYVVDDAAIVNYRACQVEAWHGERASWILPACQLGRNVELTVGAGFVDEGNSHRETKYAVEAKTLFRPLDTNSWGVGLVLGVGPNPSAVSGERRFGDAYAFVPASLSLLDDRLLPEFQVGIRTHFQEAGVEVDVSWGGHTQDDFRGAGLTVGLAIVSGRIF